MKGKAILTFIILVSFVLGCLADPKKEVKGSVADGEPHHRSDHQFPCIPSGHPCNDWPEHRHRGEKKRLSCCSRRKCYNPDRFGGRSTTGTCP
ncbi:hypothetical protein ABFA07_013079 [Porites harrisoni]